MYSDTLSDIPPTPSHEMSVGRVSVFSGTVIQITLDNKTKEQRIYIYKYCEKYRITDS